MSARAKPRRRGPGARHAGVLVHKLLWSMSYERRVRITLRDGRVRTAQACRVFRDVDVNVAKVPRGASTMGFAFTDGSELRVDAIERVQLPLGDAGAAFGEE